MPRGLWIPLLFGALVWLTFYFGFPNDSGEDSVPATQGLAEHAEAPEGARLGDEVAVQRKQLPAQEPIAIGDSFEPAMSDFASGVVQGGNGQSLAGVVITLQTPMPEDEALFVAYEDRWIDTVWQTTTDATGAFHLKADVRGEQTRLCLKADGYLEKHLPCAPRTLGMKVFLSRPWRVAGQFILKEGVFHQEMRVSLSPRGEVVFPMGWRSGVSMASDGHFRLENMPFGTWDLILWRPGVEIPFYTLPLELAADGGKLDLGTIDLRAILRRIRITALDEGEESILGAWAESVDGVRLGSSLFEPIEFLTTETQLDVRVGGDQHRTITIHDVQEEEIVILPPGFPVTLHVMDMPDLPEDWRLLGSFFPIDEDGNVDDSGLDLFFIGEMGKAVGRVPEPGSYYLNLSIAYTGDEAAHDFRMPENLGDYSLRGIFTIQNSEKQSYDLSLSDQELLKLHQVLTLGERGG